ncbi:YbaY family lipoprotein [Pseudomonas fluorescens]|uniref:Putative lipoprotein YbaY n=1 Tax=Pseudomonas fluorescens TaxID=294 RepID=A0A5E7E306_PSEFL|nr:YbaY family lipoprotein [Pseudomonas fluorescens]VVO17822.1 putative lipoprotein YbaY [Pseudomonas fluorescens]
MKKLSLLAVATLLGACQLIQPAAEPKLTGEVYYLQRIALPPSATLSVSLQDVSQADAPAVVLDEQKGPVEGQVPLPFQLNFDPAQVKPGHRYSVSAQIEVNGKLLYSTTEQHLVQLDGSDPESLKIRVHAVR